MVTEQTTENGRVETESTPPAIAPDERAAEEERELRELAIKQVERVRKFKVNLTAFLVGTFVLSCIWAITEYQNSGGWPERLSDGGNAGDWNPWILYVILGWGFFVALDAIKTYFRRPTTEAEIEREIERMKSRS
jgi:hypothetical protein